MGLIFIYGSFRAFFNSAEWLLINDLVFHFYFNLSNFSVNTLVKMDREESQINDLHQPG